MGDERRDYQPGEQIPGTVYRVVRPIGAGGMGTVYDVEDTTVGKRYVLKTLHPELCGRKDLAKRMQAEARILAGLSHPNIVEVVTAGATTDDLRLPYYVMEKLNGQNLRTILSKKGSLELGHALHIGIDLLDALDCAHEKRVIHRDVKPDNIFLHRAPNGVTLTKLLDFGIMRLLDADNSLTAGRFMGTLRYAAPEQLQGGSLTPQTDLYAAGLVLYEMIAGRGPFDDERDQTRVAAAHVQKEPPLLLGWGVIVPQSLEKLVRSALSKNIEKRPKDAFTFAAQLRNLKRMLQAESASPESRRTEGVVVSHVGSATGPSDLLPVPPASPGSTDPAYASTQQADTRASSPVAKGASPTPPQESGVLPAKDTLYGMPAPTLGRTLENAVASSPGPASSGVTAVTATSAPAPDREGIDRSAETRSLVPDVPPGMGPQGTEPIPIDVALPPWAVPAGSTLRMPQARGDSAEGIAAQQLLGALPPEQAGTRSDAASSNTLSPRATTEGKRTLARVLVAVGVFGLVGTGALLLALHLHRAQKADAPEWISSEPSASATISGVAIPSSLTPPAVPPPTLAPPLFDEVPSAVPTVPAEPPSPPRSKPARPPRTSPAQSPAASPLAPSATPSRHRLPGSGL